MKRSIFPVATVAVAILAFLGVGLSRLRPLIPNPKAAEGVVNQGDFVAQGSTQPIQWDDNLADSLARARRLDRPVLLYMGTVWNRSGKKFDQKVFTDNDVQSYLDRHFACLRLDLDENPQYLASFAPISRTINGGVSTIQMVFLLPTGQPYRLFFPRVGNADPTVFLAELVESFGQFSKVREDPSLLSDAQKVERNAVFQGAIQPSGYSSFYDELKKGINRTSGGFAGGAATSRALAWRSFLLIGDIADFKDSSRAALSSGLVDWLDGGFFAGASDHAITQIEFDKPSELNAECLLTLAMASRLMNDPIYKKVAQATFDWLVLIANDLDQVPTARLSLENRFDRDQRSSFYAKDFRQLWNTGKVSATQAKFAIESLGLDSRLNPSMVVKVGSSDTLHAKSFEPTLVALRRSKASVKLKFSEPPVASVNGTVAAALISSARIWGDSDRMKSALRIFGGLERFRSQVEISRTGPFLNRSGRFSGDYLAYADAAMAAYVATGDESKLQAGAEVLRRAKTLFATPAPGVWTPMITPAKPLLADADSPDILDCQGESLIAKMIRVMTRYRHFFDEFRADGEAAKVHFSGIAPQTRRLGAGLFNAVAEHSDDAYVLTVGPDRVAMGNRLARRIPVRFVAPRASTQFTNLKPGAYVVARGNPVGPLSENEVVIRLSPRLSVP